MIDSSFDRRRVQVHGSVSAASPQSSSANLTSAFSVLSSSTSSLPSSFSSSICFPSPSSSFFFLLFPALNRHRSSSFHYDSPSPSAASSSPSSSFKSSGHPIPFHFINLHLSYRAFFILLALLISINIHGYTEADLETGSTTNNESSSSLTHSPSAHTPSFSTPPILIRVPSSTRLSPYLNSDAPVTLSPSSASASSSSSPTVFSSNAAPASTSTSSISHPNFDAHHDEIGVLKLRSERRRHGGVVNEAELVEGLMKDSKSQTDTKINSSFSPFRGGSVLLIVELTIVLTIVACYSMLSTVTV